MQGQFFSIWLYSHLFLIQISLIFVTPLGVLFSHSVGQNTEKNFQVLQYSSNILDCVQNSLSLKNISNSFPFQILGAHLTIIKCFQFSGIKFNSKSEDHLPVMLIFITGWCSSEFDRNKPLSILFKMMNMDVLFSCCEFNVYLCMF